METRNTILNELKEIAPVLTHNQPVNPYVVPQGYFEGLADEVLRRVQGVAVSPVLEGGKENPYWVPAGYFTDFPARMLDLVRADDSGFSRSNPYEAPEGYFDQLPEIMLRRVRAEEAGSSAEELEALSPLLANLDRKTPFSVPEGYFDEMPGNLAESAQAIDLVNEELENLSPMMSGLKSKQAYKVPEGYFENLDKEILKRVGSMKPAGRVISMNFGRRLMRYAAAAVVAGLLITAGLFYINRGTQATDQSETAVAGELATVPDSVLEAYVNSETPTIGETSVTSTASADMDAEDMHEMLADISDVELQKYVDQYGGSANLLTN